MTYKSTRPIAAYTMAEFESLTSGNADFARGKDKKKRKSRKGLMAAMGAGALALGGAGARYGGAAAKTAMGQRQMYNGAGVMNKKSNKLDDWKNMKMDVNASKNAGSGGARGQLGRDIESAKQFGSKVKNYDYKGVPGKVGNAAKEGFGKARAFAGTKGGKIGLGLAGAATLAGGGYGIYKSMKKGKKK